MAEVELIMPKMGESITEATILKWLKSEGDNVELDEAVLEIATDKVDSEVPSPYAGTVTKLLYKVGDVIAVNKPIAIISTSAAVGAKASIPVSAPTVTPAQKTNPATSIQSASTVTVAQPISNGQNSGARFYSPLVLTPMARYLSLCLANRMQLSLTA